MLRTTGSSIAFLATQTDAVVVSAVANLTNYIAATAVAKPRALTPDWTVSPPADLTVTKVVLRSTKNPEMLHTIYQGPAIKAEKVFDAFAREATRDGMLSPLQFKPDHGVELAITYSNGGTPYTTTMVWDMQNQLQGALSSFAHTPTDTRGYSQARERLLTQCSPQGVTSAGITGSNCFSELLQYGLCPVEELCTRCTSVFGNTTPCNE